MMNEKTGSERHGSIILNEKEIQESLVKAIAEIASTLMVDAERDLVHLYFKDVQKSLVLKDHHSTGGILPVCVDPVTFEAFFLFGVEKLRRRDYDHDMFFYEDEQRKIHVRNALCHFHGFIDAFETRAQGSARECFEESHGLLGNVIDLWRCIMANGEFSYAMPNISPMKMVSLGFLTSEEREAMMQRFLTLDITGPAMSETLEVKFVSIQGLYDLLAEIQYNESFYDKEEPRSFDPYPFECNFTRLDERLFQPSHFYWLRPFLHSWMIERYESPFRDEEESEVALQQFPATIQLHCCPLPLSLRTLRKESDRRPSCSLCFTMISSNAFYQVAKKEYAVHIHCALRPCSDASEWRVITKEEHRKEFGQFPFFECDLLRFLRCSENYKTNQGLIEAGQVYPNLQSIFHLPEISHEARNVLTKCFALREKYLPEKEEYVRDSCRYCHRIYFKRRYDERRHSCFGCMEVGKEIHRRREERAMQQGRGRGRGRSEGGRGRYNNR